MPAPQRVLDLVRLFDRNADQYRSPAFNEANVRIQFINPMFKALGWDMENEQGHAEAYKDVIHEASLKIGEASKAPDYCFRIGGTPKFYLEAKKPFVNIKEDPVPAFQLRRYAWTKKLPLSVLTDFEEFAVYDGRVRPNQADKSSSARILYLRYTDYADKWDEIADVFARESILRGSFDKYAETKKAKRGTATVDAAFLEEIESWREELARNLALRNARLTSRELNYAVQITIDRIIFLRMCEDRGIEPYRQLKELADDADVYKHLLKLFRKADDRYNSGLFHFEKEKGRPQEHDELTPRLKLDDKVLKGILKGLYYPESPYEFSVLPAEILGQVYEQFLGKVIRLTAGHQAKVEEKPEVKKAGGVYYTPAYIVEYIVKQTVGKLVSPAADAKLDKAKQEGSAIAPLSTDPTAALRDHILEASAGSLTPKQISKLKILDPACGSGSFLLGAYQYLLDWHLAYYQANDPEKHRKEVFRDTRGAWRLTTNEKKRILLNNIHGVDIDPQAVEVTKLSLLLKVLEGETQETINQQQVLFHERALPDLASNIRCGNSLIGPDFYDEPAQGDLFADEEERLRINVFNWNAGFPTIMKAGGFDAVVGNPPYIRIQTMQDWQPREVEFFSRTYQSAGQGNYDIYVVFVERGLALLNNRGRLGFILPNKFFNALYGQPLRELLACGTYLDHVVHFGHQQVFVNATTYTCLLLLSRAGSHACEVVKVNDLAAWRESKAGERANLPASAFGAEEWNIEVGAKGELRSRLPSLGDPLGQVADIFVGLQTSADRVFVVKSSREVEPAILRPFLMTGGLRSFQSPDVTAWLIFPYEIVDGRATLIPAQQMKSHFPKAWARLKANEAKLRGRDNEGWNHGEWYAFGRSQNLTEMQAEKIVIQVTAVNPTVILDSAGLCMTGGGAGPFYGIRPRPASGVGVKYLLGLLSSRLFGWIVRTQSTPLRGGYVKYSKQYIEKAPIRRPDKNRHDRMVELVDRMLSLHNHLSTAMTPHDRTSLESQIASTDRQIEQLVYELYGLSDDEIKIVEEQGQARPTETA